MEGIEKTRTIRKGEEDRGGGERGGQAKDREGGEEDRGGEGRGAERRGGEGRNCLLIQLAGQYVCISVCYGR